MRVGAALVALSLAIGAQDGRGAADRGDRPPKTPVAYADVEPLWETLRPYLPAQLRATPADDLERAWPGWVRAHDADIRGRVARGDEDSLVNFWLFGTTFTDLPPARRRDVLLRGGGATLSEVTEARLDDLLDALAAPAETARIQWVGEVLRSLQLDPATSSGRTRIRRRLVELDERMRSEYARYEQVLNTAEAIDDPVAAVRTYASLYRDRGLSSDTSMLSSFAVDATLDALAGSGQLAAGSIRRVAVVGPGLDFINKTDGHDFYPEQTIQPFLLIDSLFRLGLAEPGQVSLTTFDVSPRVNAHLAAARARAGDGYLMQLPLSDAESWSPSLVQYWERAGRRIGDAARAAHAPPADGRVRVHAVRVRPDVVAAIVPRNLDIVLERLDPLADDQRFDLVVATDVFAYYDGFDQALAVVNVGKMLRSGGSLLSNQAVVPVAPMRPEVGQDTVVYSDRRLDHVFWYRRR